MPYNQAPSASQAYLSTLVDIRKNGQIQWVGDNKTLEVLNHTVEFDMMYPVVQIEGRRANYRFMAAEANYIIQGRNDIHYLDNVLYGFAKYSDDGYTQSGAYGPPFIDQIAYVVKTLQEDPTSRQAVLTIWRPNPRPSVDIPCTLSMQFLLRNDFYGDPELHAVVNMRSSDAFTGLLYDMFCFSVMAGVVAQRVDTELGYDLRLGSCFINAGSRHLYEKDYEAITRTLHMDNKLTSVKMDLVYEQDFLSHRLQLVADDEKSPLQTLTESFGCES